MAGLFRLTILIYLLSCLINTNTICHAGEPQNSATLPGCAPEKLGMDSARLRIIDEIVAEGLSQKKMPGAVVLIGYRGHIVYHKAFGYLQIKPQQIPMQPDTVFDLASLTKPVATASSIMRLVEKKLVDIDAPVAKYIPEFAVNGKEKITVKQLLTHTSGLIPDNSINDFKNGPTEAFRLIHELKTVYEPGTDFRYSDVGFLVLAEIVERVTGKNIHEYSQPKLFEPLGMRETGYLPNDALKKRAAVTQQRNNHWMKGEVHDPRAYALGGIAGHAGLFSTANDLALFAQMLINKGCLNGHRVMSPETVQLMSTPVKVPGGFRTLGWDSRSAYSSNRGDLFSKSAFGHGGFTGTTFWIDPQQKLFVIFLSNRVHPDGKGSVNRLSGRISTIAAAAICPNH